MLWAGVIDARSRDDRGDGADEGAVERCRRQERPRRVADINPESAITVEQRKVRLYDEGRHDHAASRYDIVI